MLSSLRLEVAARVAQAIQSEFGIDHEPVVEIAPRRELGDLAFPAGLHLARTLRRKPREIAQQILDAVEIPPGVREIRVEGAGYLNVFFDRPWVASRLLAAPGLPTSTKGAEKVIVEHTNINPNKAAHIGHLRNSVLGDTVARILRHLGRPVEVQNYIDDTGVQVADVVVGFVDLRQMTVAEIEALPEPFDFYCWDLYAEVGQWYEEDPDRRRLSRETLHELERGTGPRAEIGQLVAHRIVRRHLLTMARLDVSYDLLTHESAILGLNFFDRAFEQLKASGAVRLETSGKNKGCWVMPLSESEEFAGLEDPDKVIVRSDGTVTYVGKDIAYQLWKFGLLGLDFHYRPWDEQGLWQTALEGQGNAPEFGAGHTVINVIDARQSYLQKIVRAGLEAVGHRDEAQRSIHFAYEFVSLSPSTARQLGYAVDDESKTLDMSGRKGIGVKADDLLDQLEAKSREEIAQRNRELSPDDLDSLARAIAVAAVRFFMAKASTTRPIAFDLEEALSFEGDSGPYLQYSLVRARNIFRKLEDAGQTATADPAAVAELPAEALADDLWDLLFACSLSGDRVQAAGETLEVSTVARHALEIAQRFNAAYHKHPILHEEDTELRTARLAATRVFETTLSQLAELLGVPTPDRM